MLELTIAALLAGLVGSPHCLGMCGGFAGASAGRRGGVAAWNLGRLGTYIALGGLAGGAGGLVQWAAPPGLRWLGLAVPAALLVFFSLRLGGWSGGAARRLPLAGALVARWEAAFRRRSSGLLARPGLGARLGFGALTGLLPCGLIYTTLALPVAAGGAVEGAAVMAAFWLGTVPALATASLALRRMAAARPWVRRTIAAGVLVLGLGALAIRSPAAAPGDGPPPCHAQP